MRILSSERDYRIHQNHRIRTATFPLDGILGVRLAGVEVSANGGSQVPACGKSEDPDPRGLHVPLRRARANHANGPLCVLHGSRMMISRGEAILKHEGGNAEGIE